MTSDLVKKISRHTQHFVFIDNVISWHTANIDLVTVNHEVRNEGQSGYTLFKLIIITMSLIITYTVIPLRLMTYGGLTASFISFFIGLFFLYQKINLLFIDELIDSGMDTAGVEGSLAVLKKMGRDGDKNVFLISHKDELIGRVNYVMKVVKENGFTSYENDIDIVE